MFKNKVWDSFLSSVQAIEFVKEIEHLYITVKLDFVVNH